MFKETVWRWFQEFMDQRDKANAPHPSQEEEKQRAIQREVGRAVMAAFKGKTDSPQFNLFFAPMEHGHVVTEFTRALNWAVMNKGREVMETKLKEASTSFNKEEFIDKVVERINRKQLRPGG